LESDIAARIEVREYVVGDADAALALRNQVFPPIGPEHWAQSQTAAIARLNGRVVGVIPFVIRPFLLAPSVVIRAAFANSVAVAEDLRGMGIGTRMMAAARQFLPGHAEAMCVYTADEASGLQYRFYRRTGHHDLLYPRRMTKGVPTDATNFPPGAELAAIDAVSTLETDLLEIYAACYAGWGGLPVRAPGYWRQALDSQIFVEVPYEAFDLMLARISSQLAAYAIAGTRERETVVLECASRDVTASMALWEAMEALAASREAKQIAVHGQDFGAPLHDSLLEAGFVAQPRFDVLSGQVVAFESVYLQSLRAADGAPFACEVWTPERTLRLGPGEVSLRLEMKEDDLHRLLLRRLDLEAAVREQRVTVREGNRKKVLRLARVLTSVPWVYHHLDYV
jgi:GNAT superfamily N-acetyltransferase